MKYHALPLHLAALCMTSLFFSLFFVSSQANRQVLHSDAIPHTIQTVYHPNPQLQAFVGTWYSHGAALVLQPDGHAMYNARVYTWCGPDVPKPCDLMQGNLIISGIQMEILFSRVEGNTAYGTIITSTVDHKDTAVRLTINNNQTAQFFEDSSNNPHVLCNLHAPVGLCGA